MFSDQVLAFSKVKKKNFQDKCNKCSPFNTRSFLFINFKIKLIYITKKAHL